MKGAHAPAPLAMPMAMGLCLEQYGMLGFTRYVSKPEKNDK